MIRAIVDLTQARPHMRKNVSFTPAEFKAYNEGYYAGVIYSLRVADEAVARYQLGTRTRRTMNKKKKAG